MDLTDGLLNYTLETILNTYNIQTANKVIDRIVDNGIATKREKNKEGKIYIGDIKEPTERLKYCLTENTDLIKAIQKWEFDKNYKYSILYEVKEFSIDNLKLLLEDKLIIDSEKIEFEDLYATTMKPSLKYFDSGFYLKFNLKLDGKDVTGVDIKRRYPILTIYNNITNILEIRIDPLDTVYNKDRFKYLYSTTSWIRQFLKMNLVPLELEDIVNYIVENGKIDQVTRSGIDMSTSNGGKVTMDIGKDDSMSLPFIDELKEFLVTYKEEFERAPILKQAFEEFIYDKETLSDFHWIKLKFEEKNFDVKFTLNYGKNNECLIQHLHSAIKSNIGRERMDYVTEYLNKIRKSIKKLPVNA